ncbi:MAG TPA: hypothetical protein VJL84_00260 [Kiloniellales bacterium]|nr:hypothetical protein [Kiloniellales bacterium]
MGQKHYRRKLDKLLGCALEEDFFVMVWAIRALQTGRQKAANTFIQFPDEAATTNRRSKLYAQRNKGEEDRIGIGFCFIDDLEETIRISSETSLVTALEAASTAQFRGWQLWAVHRQVAQQDELDNEHPLYERRLEAMPWLKGFVRD